MKIGIDARLITQTGVGIYTQNLLHCMTEHIPDDWDVNVYMRPQDVHIYESTTVNIQKIITHSHWHSLAEQTNFYKQLMGDNLDLMHFTYFSYPIRYKRPFVSTVHDLTPLLHKTGRASTKSPIVYEIKYRGLQLVMKTLISQASAVITPSHTVERELITRYGTQYAAKIHTIYEGVDQELMSTEPTRPGGLISDDFFMYCGNYYPHKNVQRLITAYEHSGSVVPLVLIGPDDHFAAEIRSHIQARNLDRRVIMLSRLTRAEIAYCYKTARALVHPTLAEGFGLTILEAAALGCPIIASDIPIFREIMGDSYVAFDPRSISDIAAKISACPSRPHTITHPDILNKYSFETMARETVDLYKKVLNNR